MKKRKLKVFLSIADRIIPPDDDSPGAGSMETAGIVDWALERTPAVLRSQFLILMVLVEILGFMFGGKPFTKNSDKAKDRQLRWMENNSIQRLRLGFFGVKNFVCMGYYTREDIWGTIGYEGPVIANQPYVDSNIRLMCQGRMQVVE